MKNSNNEDNIKIISEEETKSTKTTPNVDFEIKDLSFDGNIDLKLNNNSSDSAQMQDVSDDKTNNNSAINNQSNNNEMQDVSDDNTPSDANQKSDVINNNQPDSGQSKDDSGQNDKEDSDNKENKNSDGEQPQNQADAYGNQAEKQNLRNNAKSLKNDFNNKVDQIKNAPENIKNKINDTKNKINDTKDKINDAKDKIKNAPDNLRKKRDAVKDKWKNRPKTKEDFKNKFKNGGANLKNKAKNGAKNLKDKAKNSVKDKANEKTQDIKNKVDKVKNTVDKAKKVGKAVGKAAKGLWHLFVSTLPWSAIIIGIILIAILIVTIIVSLSPGIGGDASDKEIYSQYSEVDQKTMEKMADLFGKYSNADGTLAMAVVIYPYYTTLYDGNVTSYIDKTEKETTQEDIEPDVDDNDTEVTTDTENTSDSETDTTEDDPYLVVLRSSKARRKLKAVLKKLESSSAEDFKAYLKQEYFLKDKGYGDYDTDVSNGYIDGYNGYKQMLKEVSSDNQDAFMDAVIENLYDIKDNFVDYVYKNPVCGVSMVSAGQVSIDEILTKNILVDVKVESCTAGSKSGIESCQSKYDSPITLEKYIKSVTYEEIGVSGSSSLSEVETQMVAAKSFVLGRYKIMGWDVKTTDDGSYVIPIRSNTNDQDFCDIDTGCQDKLNGAKRGPLDAAASAIMNQAWEETKNTYIYDQNKSTTVGAYCQSRTGVCSFCKTGSCMAHEELSNYTNVDFKTILVQFYSNYSLISVENNLATATVAGQKTCTNGNTNMTAQRAQIVSTALEQVGKVPYYDGGLASAAGYDGNDFNTDIQADSKGRTKKGLDSVGFINWIYWGSIQDNLGNTDSIDTVLSQTFEITQDKLLMGDIGYSEDKTVIAIYAGDNKWVMEDDATGNVVSKPDDRLTKFARLNKFKDEAYNFTIRKEKPTTLDWNSSKPWFNPSVDNTGQCPWYARNRAGEIIYNLYTNGSLTEKQYSSLLSRVLKTSGNGGDFYPGGRASTYGYQGSNNIDDIKGGSFMGLDSASAPQYGHVAIIEYANQSEDKIIVTDGWCKQCSNSCSSTFSCVNFRYQEFTYATFKSNYSGTFKGYLYFLQE